VSIQGARISASSSASDADNLGGARPANSPYAAVDGDPSTAWRPAIRVGGAGGDWWRLGLDSPVTAPAITVTLAPGATVAPLLRVTTDGSARTVRLRATVDPQQVDLPGGSTRTLTLGSAGGPLALAEVAVPGVSVSRTVVTPPPPVPASVYAFDTIGPAAAGCASEPSGVVRCSPALVRPPEEPAGIDRVFTVAAATNFSLAATVVPRAGAALDALIAATARPTGVEVTASSSAVPDPRGSADAAVDGDPHTTWTADPADPSPALTLHWPTRQTIDRIRVRLTPGTAAARPVVVGLSTGGLVRPVTLAADGAARFAPIVTDTLVLTFPVTSALSSFDPYARSVTPLGVGVSEIVVAGVHSARSGTVVDAPCGSGPPVTIDGASHATSLHTTLGALRALEPVPVHFCDPRSAHPALGAGVHRLAASSTATFALRTATLTRAGAAPAAADDRTPGRILRWDAEDRLVGVVGRNAPALLVVPENVNDGWTATLDGRRLESRVVDGWQQGYVLPTGRAGVVHLVFAPGTYYRAALGGGALAVLLLLALLLPSRGPTPPATRRRAAGAGLALALLVGLLVLGGVVGLAAGGAAVVLGRLARGRRPVVLAVVTVLAGAAAGAVLLATGGGGEAATQTLVLIALAAVAVALFPGPATRRGGHRSGTTWRSRLSGRSTAR
jgi:arabinofuranan 3-O-arabinosyltransferase